MDRRISQLTLKTSLSAIADLAMPRVCVVCGRDLTLQEKDICLPCLEELPETHFFKMSRNPMADKFNEKVTDDRYCYASALFFYNSESAYRRIPQALKYGRNLRAGKHFSRILARRLADSELFKDVDLVIPVPLHRIRKWKRGYNQAEIIAREVASELGADLDCSLLRRTRNTSSQTRLGVEEKKENVEGAFAVKGTIPGREVRHILLIDDVFTTGATTAGCHRALRTAFGTDTRISAATLAFVSN
ncbi:MAG: ComF family protein [Bacteroidales bacterium]|nr:ComF family protein [Bacteroidales bacterium]